MLYAVTRAISFFRNKGPRISLLDWPRRWPIGLAYTMYIAIGLAYTMNQKTLWNHPFRYQQLDWFEQRINEA